MLLVRDTGEVGLEDAVFRLPSTLRRNFSAFGTVAIVEVRSTGQQEIQERLAAEGYSVGCGSKSSLQRIGRW